MSDLHVVNILEEGRFGGPQRRVAAVAAGLRAIGVETTVILPDRHSGRLQEVLGACGVSYVTLRLHKLSRHGPELMGFILGFIPEVVCLRRAILRLNPTVIHCNGSWQIKGLLAAKLSRKPVIWHMNDSLMPWIFRALVGMLGVRVDGFIASSTRSRDYYLGADRLSKVPVRVIRPPVDSTHFRSEGAVPHAELAESRTVRVVTVAHLNPVKDLETFLRMADGARRTSSVPLSFWVFGPVHDSQRRYLSEIEALSRELALDEVRFMGPTEDVVGVLAAADIFVCSSRSESGPMSVLEALSMGVPVVSTDVGDLAELFAKHSCGFVVPVGDDAALADRVCELAQDSALRAKLGAAGRLFAQNSLDLTHVVDSHADFYREVGYGRFGADAHGLESERTVS